MDFLKTPEMRLHADAKVQDIIDEIKSGERDEVAWVKALKAAKGNTSYAQALYIEERIKRLADFQHVVAVHRKLEHKANLEGELNEIDTAVKKNGDKVGLFAIIFFPLFLYLVWVENYLSAALVFLALFPPLSVYSIQALRFKKKREEVRTKLDKLSPQPDPTRLSAMILFAIVIAAVGYFLASL